MPGLCLFRSVKGKFSFLSQCANTEQFKNGRSSVSLNHFIPDYRKAFVGENDPGSLVPHELGSLWEIKVGMCVTIARAFCQKAFTQALDGEKI